MSGPGSGLRILIVGCGDIGVPLAQALVNGGAEVWGLRRRPGELPAFIHPLAADVTDAGSLGALDELAFDYVVMTLTPAEMSERGYRSVFIDGVANLLDALHRQPAPRRIFHVSSTSVYHQRDGEWVDESSPATPASFSGKALLQGEQLLFDCGIPVTVVRFAGIYGPGRRRLIDQVLAGQGCPRRPPLYTNRIHRDDCAGVLLHLILRDAAGEAVDSLYLGVDSEPVPLWEVKQWMARQLGVELDADKPSAAPARRNSKRCSNARLLSSGYQLRYPDFRRGYAALLESYGLGSSD